MSLTVLRNARAAFSPFWKAERIAFPILLAQSSVDAVISSVIDLRLFTNSSINCCCCCLYSLSLSSSVFFFASSASYILAYSEALERDNPTASIRVCNLSKPTCRSAAALRLVMALSKSSICSFIRSILRSRVRSCCWNIAIIPAKTAPIGAINASKSSAKSAKKPSISCIQSGFSPSFIMSYTLLTLLDRALNAETTLVTALDIVSKLLCAVCRLSTIALTDTSLSFTLRFSPSLPISFKRSVLSASLTFNLSTASASPVSLAIDNCFCKSL